MERILGSLQAGSIHPLVPLCCHDINGIPGVAWKRGDVLLPVDRARSGCGCERRLWWAYGGVARRVEVRDEMRCGEEHPPIRYDGVMRGASLSTTTCQRDSCGELRPWCASAFRSGEATPESSSTYAWRLFIVEHHASAGD